MKILPRSKTKFQAAEGDNFSLKMGDLTRGLLIP